MQRDKIIECADGIIDYISEQLLMDRVVEDFGMTSVDNDEDGAKLMEIANAVYDQIKLRM